MKPTISAGFHPVLLAAIALASGALQLQTARADAFSEVALFSSLPAVDEAKLAGGKPLTARGAPMNFPRGLSVQACYIVPLPLQKTVEFHKQWNASKHSDLKVYFHKDLPAKPTVADFQSFASVHENGAIHSFVEATQKLNPSHPELQMSLAEAKQFGKGESGAGKGGIPAPVVGFWSNLLSQRTRAFVEGGFAKQPPYQSSESSDGVRASDEVARLLKEQPKIRDEFKALLGETALGDGAGRLTPALYFELFDVEGRAAFTLGASYSKQAKDGAQAIDAQFYASDGYFALVTLYQFWPITTASGQQATLVWRGDLISSASLAELHGVERMGSTSAMMREVQKSIALLQQDAAAGR